jgi:hypothetical protein
MRRHLQRGRRPGSAERADEVASGAALHHREVGRGRSGHAVCDLRDGAVAAHRHHQLHPLGDGRRRQLCRVSAPLGQAHLDVEAVRLGPPRDIGPLPGGAAVGRRRVGDHHCCGHALASTAAASASRHPLDAQRQLVVGDAHQLGASDQIGDGQDAGRLDRPQRTDREQHGGLHLDRQHAALGPAQVAFWIRVVDRVGRGDRAHARLDAESLGGVDGAVREAEVRCGGMRLATGVVA